MKTVNFYDWFSFIYPVVDIFLSPQKRKLFEEINNLSPGKLLEIGVGDGRHLHQYKSHEIVAIDNSVGMLKIAARQNAQGVELLVMNAECLKFKDESFDYVVLSHVIAVVDNPETLVKEIHRVLKNGGKLLILNHFTPKNWLSYLDKLFEPVSRIFHFRSVFHIDSISAIKKFSMVKETSFGRRSYFKLLILIKA